MAIDAKKYLFAILFLVLPFFVFAQTGTDTQPRADLEQATLDSNAPADASGSSSYFIRETEEGIRFIQKIDWDPVDNVLRYEVVVEQRYGNSERYNEVIRESVEDPFIEVSIPPGDYRFKVLVYNLLNRLDGESDYLYFNVFRAVQPFIGEITPGNIYMDEDQARRVTLIGDNFVLGAKIFLVPVREGAVNNSENQRGVLVPAQLKYSDIGDTVELIFNEQDLLINNYRIVVVNPGGLTSTYESLSIKFQKPWDINVSAGYAPMIPLFAASSDGNDLKTVLDTPFYPIGFTAKVSYLPYKQVFGYFGLELAPFFNYISSESDTYILSTSIFGGTLSFLYQKPILPKKLFFNARIGGGIASYLGMHFDYKNGIESEPMSTWFPIVQVGVSGQYFIYKKLFVELGVDFKIFFAKDMPIGYLSPSLTGGWQF